MNRVSTRSSIAKMIKFGTEAKLRLMVMRDKKRLGNWLTHELTRLGPAYVKWGQFLSTRSDIMDKEVTLELTNLQDNITPVPFSDIQRTIESEFGRPMDDMFAEVNPVCIASASIGQVHRGRLKESNREVAIKIQKPGVVESILGDIDAIKFLNKIMSFGSTTRGNDISNLVRQYESFLSAEIDYTRELQNMRLFGDAAQDGSVRIPRVYPSLSTQRVLTMEYVPSIKVTEIEALRAKGVDPAPLAYTLIDLFLHQITTTGLVHCDPHPGNIGVHDDGTTLVMYDFGNVIQLSDAFRSQIKNVLFSVYQRDVDEFVDLLVALKVLDVKNDEDKLEIKAFFQYFFEYLENLDLTTFKASIVANDLLRDTKVTFKVEQDFLSLVRVFSLLDGTCIRLCPNFNYNKALQPYVASIWADLDFLQYVAMRDINRLTRVPQVAKSMENQTLGVSQRLKKTELAMGRLKWVALLSILVEDVEQPLKIVCMALAIVLLWVSPGQKE